MISNIRIEDIGVRQSKYRILFDKDNQEHILSRTFSMKSDALIVVNKLRDKQEDILR